MSDIETIKALQAENARLISLVKEIEDALIASKAAQRPRDENALTEQVAEIKTKSAELRLARKATKGSG